jgi:glycosyltransferase involved in cell wall biosynthesis
VSRIAPQKRLDVLIEAAALLAGRLPGLRWLVAGDGDVVLLAELERLGADRAAPVTFLGARSDVPKLMATAHAFALPSDWEARALVVQEAMAAGLPVVATAVGGLPELLGSTGLLVPPGDPLALAQALERVLTDPALAADLAHRARQRFAELPTEVDVVAAWSRRYDDLLAGRGVTRPA